MTERAKEIAAKLNKTVIDTDVCNTIIKDRLDFGFDSIYFRYAEVCDELAAYMARADHIDPVEARHRMNGRKMHFYQALEQLVQAHPEREEDPF